MDAEFQTCLKIQMRSTATIKPYVTNVANRTTEATGCANKQDRKVF